MKTEHTPGHVNPGFSFVILLRSAMRRYYGSAVQIVINPMLFMRMVWLSRTNDGQPHAFHADITAQPYK